MDPAAEEVALLEQANTGNSEALGELLSRHRRRLSHMIRLRLDPRVRKRLNPSDVLQDVSIEVTRRLRSYLAQPDVPFFVWLRFLTGQRIAQLHRRHLGTQSRDVDREVSFHNNQVPALTSAVIAERLVANETSPSEAARKAEVRRLLQVALDSMDAMDREVLALRHFEQLTNSEVSHSLNISPTAANNRYIRALERLRGILIQEGDFSHEA